METSAVKWIIDSLNHLCITTNFHKFQTMLNFLYCIVQRVRTHEDKTAYAWASEAYDFNISTRYW